MRIKKSSLDSYVETGYRFMGRRMTKRKSLRAKRPPQIPWEIDTPERKPLPLVVLLDLDSTLLWSYAPVKAWDAKFGDTHIRPGVVNFLKTLKSRNVKLMILSHRTGLVGLKAVQALNVACGEEIFAEIGDPFKVIIWPTVEGRGSKNLTTLIPYEVDRRRCILIDDSVYCTYHCNLHRSIPAFASVFPKLDYMNGMTQRILPQVLACLDAWNRSAVSDIRHDRPMLEGINEPRVTKRKRKRNEEEEKCSYDKEEKFPYDNDIQIKYLPDYELSVRQLVQADGETVWSPASQQNVIEFDEADDPVGFTLKNIYQIQPDWKDYVKLTKNGFCEPTADMKNHRWHDAVLGKNGMKSLAKSDCDMPYCLMMENYRDESIQSPLTEAALVYKDRCAAIESSIHKQWEKMVGPAASSGYFQRDTCEVKMTGSYVDYNQFSNDMVDPKEYFSSLDYLTGLNKSQRDASPILSYWLRFYSLDQVEEFPDRLKGKLMSFPFLNSLKSLSLYGGKISIWPLSYRMEDCISDLPQVPFAPIKFSPGNDYVSWFPTIASSYETTLRAITGVIDNLELRKTFFEVKDRNTWYYSDSRLMDTFYSSLSRTPCDLRNDFIQNFLGDVPMLLIFPFLDNLFLTRNGPIAPLSLIPSKESYIRDLYAKLFPLGKLPVRSDSSFDNSQAEKDVAYYLYQHNRHAYFTTHHKEKKFSGRYEFEMFDKGMQLYADAECSGQLFDWCTGKMIHDIATFIPNLQALIENVGNDFDYFSRHYPDKKLLVPLNLLDKTILPIYVAYDEQYPFEELVSHDAESDLTRRVFHSLYCPEMDYYEFCHELGHFKMDPVCLAAFIRQKAKDNGIDNLYIMIWVHLKGDCCKAMKDRHLQSVREWVSSWTSGRIDTAGFMISDSGCPVTYYDYTRDHFVGQFMKKK